MKKHCTKSAIFCRHRGNIPNKPWRASLSKILWQSAVRFQETIWRQMESFVTIDNKKGWVEIFYLEEFPKLYEGPFMKEERNLIVNIAQLIAGYLNNFIGRDALNKREIAKISESKNIEYRDSLIKKSKPLQQYFNQQTLDKYIYLDMMKYKVKEILFVATFYDAFILENEDAFFEQFMGEIYQYSLFSLPRITAVTSEEQALYLAESAKFDFAILTVGEDEKAPVELAKRIKELRPDLKIFLLLNKKGNVKYFETLVATSKFVDNLFIWHGDSQIFFAIVKSIEDRVNVENDTSCRAGQGDSFNRRFAAVLFKIPFRFVLHRFWAHSENYCLRKKRARQNIENALAAKNTAGHQLRRGSLYLQQVPQFYAVCDF